MHFRCDVVIAGLVGAVLLAELVYGQASVVDEVRTSMEMVAGLDGSPGVLSAGGITRDETPLWTIENRTPFQEARARRRLVLLGGFEGRSASARVVLDAVRWFKTEASDVDRGRWAVSALPLADPDGAGAGRSYRFPPVGGYFDDPDLPESHYVWRWVAYQVPDLVVVVTSGAGLRLLSAEDADGSSPGGVLVTALASGVGHSDLGPVEALQVTASDGDGPALMRALLSRMPEERSPLRRALEQRVDRTPLEVARLLAGRYPEAPSMSYISGVAWLHALRLARV
ncbi:uncharacterized protein METZ01_LOCUS107987, partial [marine metagenome]